MKSRYIVKLFWTTLLIGGAAAGIIGFIVRWSEFSPYFTDFNLGKILSTLAWLFGVGMIFSVISQMGFFAFLTVHQIGLGIFRSYKLWGGVQILFILVALFDVVYFRHKAFGGSLAPYLIDAAIIFVVGLIVAYAKMKQTNKDTFISTLFFMTVLTIIEWVPVLRVNEESWLYLMLFPLLICNTYQILILHKFNRLSAEESQKPPK